MNGTTRGEIVDEASNWLVGGGIVTMALAPPGAARNRTCSWWPRFPCWPWPSPADSSQRS